MYLRNFEPLFLFVILMLGKPQAYGTEANNCTAAVNVPRNTEYRIKPGVSAIIKCPVTHCPQKPEIRWYKMENHSDLILHVGQRYTFTWMEENTFVLNFSSIHKNDSGLYHCESISGQQKNKGHYINITVQDEDTNTTDGHGTSGKDKDHTWLIYLLSSLGALCLIIICCLCPLYFTWRLPVKNEKIPSVSESEMNVSNSNADVKNNNDNSIRVPLEGSMLHHGTATPGLLKYKHGSTTCDDQVNFCKASRATSHPAGHPSVTGTPHIPCEDSDMLLYAVLSHGMQSQGSEPSEEIEFTEYATIRQKN